MKNKTLIVIGAILVILILVPIVSRISWTFQPKKPLQVCILDKTVPQLDRIEHMSFNWILTYNKYVKNNKRIHKYKKDYYGFMPKRPIKDKLWDPKRIRLMEIPDMANEYDALYYTDTYGVYYNDWLRGMQTTSTQSTLLYGGMKDPDYNLMKFMKDRNKLIIAEYNILAPPTSRLVRYQTEEQFDIRWTGWTGKYYSSLDQDDQEVPKWLIQSYKNAHYGKWPFTKAGIIFIKNNQTIVILEDENHLKSRFPIIVTADYGLEKYEVPDSIEYLNWFDITYTGERNQIVSSYKIDVTQKGDSLLRIYKIPNSFPAIIESLGDYPFYYFAGDFAENKVSYFTARFKWIKSLDFLFYSDDLEDKSRFYWKFYFPLMSNILENYYINKPE